ncbi:MAG: molybdopterin molybdotransferase MoeA [Gemmatimonadota bacterium]|nr:molybdopterin molybdotransferase MoeA [Gemmatimonadota bacterium]
MSDADWVTSEQALASVLGSVDALGAETVRAEEALGRALAQPLDARVDHPPWDNSAMDGFAVHSADVAGASRDAPAVLAISDDIPAGQFPTGPLASGTAARIMTGAPVPEGASGVVRVEHTDGGGGDHVAVFRDQDANRNIRKKAEDISKGQRLLERGSEVTPAVVALLAMNGLSEVSVGRRPRIGVIANGDELADPDDFDEVLAGRRIANSNSPGLCAQILEAGGIPVSLGIARDDPDSLERCIRAGADCDGLVSAAGVSVGDHDYVKEVLDDLEFERAFWRITMRPGSATLFGLLDGRPFWGVPGNPVSALVTFEVLGRPALRRMAGFADVLRAEIPCRLAESMGGATDVTSFLRVELAGWANGMPSVRLSGRQGSGVLSSMVADGLLVLPVGAGAMAAGETGRMIPLRRLAVPFLDAAD